MSMEETKEIVPVEITVESLKTKIYMVRGQRVMSKCVSRLTKKRSEISMKNLVEYQVE